MPDALVAPAHGPRAARVHEGLHDEALVAAGPARVHQPVEGRREEGLVDGRPAPREVDPGEGQGGEARRGAPARASELLQHPVGVLEDADAPGTRASEDHRVREPEGGRVDEVVHDGVQDVVAAHLEAEGVAVPLAASAGPDVPAAVGHVGLAPAAEERTRTVAPGPVALLRRPPLRGRAQRGTGALPAVGTGGADAAALQEDDPAPAVPDLEVVARGAPVQAPRRGGRRQLL
mmetsp:Transcript_55649/g.178545  ORF Transcript_55649/g.178545 Transcript_55649/m.178545 type:complete len:233 (-) Transcript_55649:235-933(-)